MAIAIARFILPTVSCTAVSHTAVSHAVSHTVVSRCTSTTGILSAASHCLERVGNALSILQSAPLTGSSSRIDTFWVGTFHDRHILQRDA